MSASEPFLTDVAVVNCLHQPGCPPQAAVHLLRVLQGDAEKTGQWCHPRTRQARADIVQLHNASRG